MRTSQLLLNEPPLVFSPTLAAMIGLNQAIILQQIHYWLLRSAHEWNGKTWVYNSYQEWAKQVPWLKRKGIATIIRRLEADGLLETGQPDGAGTRKWYRIDHDALDRVLSSPEDTLSSKGTGLSSSTDSLSSPEDTNEPDSATDYQRLPETTQGKPKPTRKRAAPDGPITEVFDAVLKHLGNPDVDPIPHHASEAREIKAMLVRGFTVEAIVEFWKKKVRQKGGGYVTMRYVNQDIPVPGVRQASLLPTEDELMDAAERKGLT